MADNEKKVEEPPEAVAAPEAAPVTEAAEKTDAAPKAEAAPATEKKAAKAAKPDKDYKPRLKADFDERIVPAMTERFGYKNRMEVPRLDKIVINMGVGEAT